MHLNNEDLVKIAKIEYGRKPYYGNIDKLQIGQILDYVVQKHQATRRGLHRDVRLGDKRLGLYSWATNHGGLPDHEGEQHPAIRTNLHSHYYRDWEGVIPAGKYGAGRVSKQESGKALITNKTDKTLSFTKADKRHPERYTFVNPYGDEKWITLKQKTPDNAGAEKQHYKNVSADKVIELLKNLPEGSSVQAKLDGALQFLNLNNRKAEMLSHRTSKTTGKPVIQTERFFGHRPHFDLPKELRNSVLRAEVYGEKDGKTIPPQELSGILNSTIEKALSTQKDNGVNLKALLFDVAKNKGKDIDNNVVPYADRRALLEKFMKHLPEGKFTLPEEAKTPEAAQKLYGDIFAGKHKQTTEGIVIHPKHGVPMKHKITPDADVHIRGFQKATAGSKYDGKGIGAIEYSHVAGGAVNGKIGSGISDALRRMMHEDPDAFIGRVAKIKSMGKYDKSTAHRMPVFHGLRED